MVNRSHRGMTLVEVVVGSALALIVFLAIFGALRLSALLTTLTSAQAESVTIAEAAMEYLRGFTYNQLGTIGGIPSGIAPQFATTTINGVTFVTHTFIQYVDDPADGLQGNDSNGITTDYKLARVEVTYSIQNSDYTTWAVSNFAPPNIETTTGGGTLQIRVVNATGTPITSADVQIINSSITPAINVVTETNANGIVYLGGAATSTSYQVSVSRDGYSSAQTYARDINNQNPTPGFLTVVKDQTTTATFAIDALSSLVMTTLSPIVSAQFVDLFSDSSNLAITSSTTVTAGVLTLQPGSRIGYAQSVPISPNLLATWENLTATSTVPSGASMVIHIYGNGALVPDAILPGNTVGFSAFPVSLASISPSNYPSLIIEADMVAPDDVNLPNLDAWSISYTAGPFPRPNTTFSLRGAKTIGSTGGGTPIYKTTLTSATGADATKSLTLEWDTYTPSFQGNELQAICPASPIPVAPGTTLQATAIVDVPTANSARVLVTDNAGVPVDGARVILQKAGFSQTKTSAMCGNAFFGSIAAGSYTISISKQGYVDTQLANVTVSGATTATVSFP